MVSTGVTKKTFLKYGRQEYRSVLYSRQGYWWVVAQCLTNSVISKDLMICRLYEPLTPYLNEFKKKPKGKINFLVIYFSNLKAFEAKLSLSHKHVSRNIIWALHLQKTLSHSMSDRLIIQDLIQQLFNQKRTFICHFAMCHLYVSASMQSSSGKSLTMKYTVTASVKNVRMWSEKYKVFN